MKVKFYTKLLVYNYETHPGFFSPGDEEGVFAGLEFRRESESPLVQRLSQTKAQSPVRLSYTVKFFTQTDSRESKDSHKL